MRRAACGLSALLCVIIAMGLPLSAAANTPIASFAAVPSTTQAGGHPDIEVSFTVKNRIIQESQSPCNCEDAKDSFVHLPAGVIGNPHATPQCTLSEFAANACAIDSQVGIANVGASVPGLAGIGRPFNTAVYNLIPPPDEAGLLGFKTLGFNTPIFTVLSPRTGTDFGLDADTLSIEHVFPLLDIQQVLWGVPASPSHDALRLNPADNPEIPGFTAYQGELCNAKGERTANETNEPILDTNPNEAVEACEVNGTLPPTSSNSPETPFLQNPTQCNSALSSSLEILSYDGGVTEANDPWPQMAGCDQLSFNPSLYAQPTTTDADTASGLDVDLEVPQQVSPSVPSPTELRAATVTLPEGFSINAGAADGKTACTDAEALIGSAYASEAEAHCPEDSEVGSLTIESSALPGPLSGFVYLGAPEPGNRYRIFLVANGFATHVKLAGTVTPDPTTGQLTVSFQDLPQTPLTAFNMHFFGSERGLLATPTQCGEYPINSTFTPWDASLPAQTSVQYFRLTSGPDGAPCPGPTRPFSPGFQAASLGHTGGAHTPFSLELTRPDGDQNLASLTVTTPPGFTATLKGVAYCPQAQIEAAGAESYSGTEQLSTPSCPADSQIGESVVGAGAGTHPVYLAGKVYLAGPYDGSPLSLVVITPAVSGPYDLGSVVVREGIRVNSETAQVTTVGSQLPQIFQGIPLRLRSIRINLDRPNFTLNPTNCSPFAVVATATGNQGAQSHLSQHFQVANCGTLPFAPKLALKLKGPSKRAGNPALSATLTYPSAPYANIAKAQVSLPHSEFLDQAHIGTVCTRPELAAEQCPAASVYGHAQVETPLLEKPLEGPVYLGTGYGTKLPELVADLNGQIHVILRGKIDTDKEGGIRTTFEAVPDAPVSNFTISLDGGKKGLLENSEDLCTKPQKATADFTGQNGKVDDYRALIANSCGGKAEKHKSHKAHRSDKSGRAGR